MCLDSLLFHCFQFGFTFESLKELGAHHLLPYLKLTTTSMKRNTLIKHKEAGVICKESGPII
jgi:hypothetical protein